MIDVTLEPPELVAGQPNELTIRLTNAGRGTCTNVVFKLALPVQLALLRGSGLIEVPRLDAEQSVTRTVSVLPKSIGAYVLSSSNFSYCDALGQPQRTTGLCLGVTVVPVPDRSSPPVPEFAVELRTSELPFEEWETLEGRVVNVGHTPLQQVSLRALGPVTCVPGLPLQTLGALRVGEAAGFGILLRANERGNKVPVYVEINYTDTAGRTGRRAYLVPVRVAMSSNKSNAARETAAPAGAAIPILFLAANPVDTSRLRLDEELREIQEKLQLARMRDRFVFHTRMAVRAPDISQALLDTQPRIVHLSGHGNNVGAVYVEDRMGKSNFIEPEALADLFDLVSNSVDCVILNACFSESQAVSIARCIKYVIGMSQTISDRAAVAFSIGFYQALGADNSIEKAYKFGCAQIRLQNIPGHQTPVLVKMT